MDFETHSAADGHGEVEMGAEVSAGANGKYVVRFCPTRACIPFPLVEEIQKKTSSKTGCLIRSDWAPRLTTGASWLVAT